MSNEERIELLKQVAEVAPKEMDARLYDGVVFFHGAAHQTESRPWVVPAIFVTFDDYYSSTAIIAMLDAINNAGHGCSVSTYRKDLNKPKEFSAKCAVFLPLEGDRDFDGYGSTRAEAVAKSFVQVFDKEAAD